MAHSLFEPAPATFHEKLWRRVQDLNPYTGREPARDVAASKPALAHKADRLDARGRQQLLEAVLTKNPIIK